MAEALIVGSPVAGRVVAMRDVPDPVFAESIVGPGLAIDPDPELGGRVVAPCAGVVVKLHPHAFVLLVPSAEPPGPAAAGPARGRGVLVHLGIDTVADMRIEIAVRALCQAERPVDVERCRHAPFSPC